MGAGKPTRLGLRVRLVLVSVAVVALAMLLGGSGLVYLLEDNLETAATNTAGARALEVCDVVTSIGLSEATQTILSEARSGQLVQIVAPDHTVYAASTSGLTGAPLVPAFPGPGQTTNSEGRDYLGVPGEWAVVSRGVSARDRTYVVHVAVPIDAAREAVRSVASYLLISTPVLLGLAALVVWLLLGRALGVVDRMRAEVERIDHQHLSRRLDVPATRDEIAALAGTLNDLLDRLERADLTQRGFVSDASHELRSPLTTVTTAAELVRTAQGPRRERLLDTFDSELARIRGLVEDLMTLARAEARSSVGRAADVDADDLIEEQRRRLSATSPLRVEAGSEPVRVRGDVDELSRALRNLIDNGERHARTALRLAGRREGDECVIWVDDDGPAIAAADRERIFERFVRLEDSRSRDSGGSGLGLAITRTLVEGHGGVVAVVDAPDGWCRFEIRLPVDSASAQPVPATVAG